MKCTNKKRILAAIFLIPAILLTGCIGNDDAVTKYEESKYQGTMHEESFFADTLCVTNEDIMPEKLEIDEKFHALVLFDIEQNKVHLSDHVHERLYPASTTKIMTLYLALKYGNLSDTVTISEKAVSVPSDSSVAGLQEGDSLALSDLLYGLMLPSGNDAAVAVAEHISGSVKEFVSLMNQEARLLGATNTHFTSPHGYQNKKHYTTAYDLYLMLNQAVSDERFCDIVSSASHSASITDRNGSRRSVTWYQTNQFINGQYAVPDGVTVIGGKTGTTDEAGACLTLYVKDADERRYIAIIMGADTKPILYDTMEELLSVIPTLNK